MRSVLLAALLLPCMITMVSHETLSSLHTFLSKPWQPKNKRQLPG